MSFLSHFSLNKSGRRAPRFGFVVIALLAITMNLLAGAGVVHSAMMSGNATDFASEICTANGLVQPSPTGKDSATASSTPDALLDHSCCGACAVGGAPLAGDAFNGVSPAPTGELELAARLSPRPASLAAKSHRPRGPPLV